MTMIMATKTVSFGAKTAFFGDRRLWVQQRTGQKHDVGEWVWVGQRIIQAQGHRDCDDKIEMIMIMIMMTKY